MDALVIFGILVVAFFLACGAYLAAVGKPTDASTHPTMRDESTLDHWHTPGHSH